MLRNNHNKKWQSLLGTQYLSLYTYYAMSAEFSFCFTIALVTRNKVMKVLTFSKVSSPYPTYLHNIYKHIQALIHKYYEPREDRLKSQQINQRENVGLWGELRLGLAWSHRCHKRQSHRQLERNFLLRTSHLINFISFTF